MENYSSPQALAISPDGDILYAAEADSRTIAIIETNTGTILNRISMPAEPTGLAVSPEVSRLYVTCSAPEGTVSEIDLDNYSIIREIPAGHGARAPVVSRNGRLLYVCNRFANTVSVINLSEGREITQIPCPREPYDAVVSKDGNKLFVAGHLPLQPSNSMHVAGGVFVIDCRRNAMEKIILLPNGSTGLRGIAISPDGKHIFVTHILARYTIPASQLEQGWINTNALSVIDAESAILIESVLLDQPEYGAANPWGIVCTPDGRYVCVTHAGTHEISVIGYHELIEILSHPGKRTVPVSQDLSFLYDMRRRVKLPGNGPRAIIANRNSVYVAEYFTDSIVRITIDKTLRTRQKIALTPPQDNTIQRRGQLFFNDALMCFQQWQSCASCHPDGRTDGLNWDLLNDGIGNPKNAMSLLLAHQTPPAMSTGIRANAEVGVRAGLRYILFTVHPEEDAQAIDAYLKSLKPVPSPYLVDEKLSSSAENGKHIFNRQDIDCAKCHPEPLFTDLQAYDVGTHSTYDFTASPEGKSVPQIRFDTPTLRELWRTAPYLHDGRYYTLEKLFREGRHGLNDTQQLTEEELQDLIIYVLSL